MIARLGRGAVLLAIVYGVGRGAVAQCETSVAAYFSDEPAGALIRRVEPGLGFSMALPDASADAVSRRLKISAAEGNKILAVDPVTGLAVIRRHRWLADVRLLLVETTLANNGHQPRRVKSLALGDWTLRLRDAQDAGYRKLTYRNDVWYGSTYWAGPDWTRVGRNWHHPGTNTPSVRRFTVPQDGRVTISGRVYKLDTKPSDGVRLSIRHRNRAVWQAEIDGSDEKGVEPDLELDVRAGDAIRFVVHKRGKIYCDTTHWDPLITYPDGRRFQASGSFSTTKQGLGGWSYEMEADGEPEPGLPRLRSFGPDLSLRDSALRAEEEITCDGRNALPVVLAADGLDEGGILIAVSGSDSWRLRAALDRDERLHVEMMVGDREAGLTLKPGESVGLARVVLGAYAGPWLAGMTKLQGVLDPERPDLGIDELRSRIRKARDHAAVVAGRAPELDLWLAIQAEWRREDKLTETTASYAEATARHLQKAGKLLDDLQGDYGPGFLQKESVEMGRLAKLAEVADLSLDERRSLYQRVRWLKRHIALSNPLMSFGKLLFCKRVPTSYSHLVMQYFGWRARPGGGIFVLERPGYWLACRDILDGRLADGSVLEPRLSYDAQRIVFSFVECQPGKLDPSGILNDVDDGFYHIYEVNVDGSGLRQLTSGPYDDLMPTYLPDGGIAFCSTRRRGYARCFGAQFSRRWHVYTLHRMDADGGNLRTLSFHDTNEWFPAVSNTGMILYARWDYIDRDAVTHQNLWATRPDGTNPFALWGNATASPHCAFQLQPIPGSSKVVFTASAHHSIAGGSIAVVDPAVNNNGQEAVIRVTPEVPFPEAEGRNVQEYYTAPWPLSEEYFLVGYSPTPLVWEPGANEPNALGIYLLDVWGNRELIYRDGEIGSTNPCPLVPRPEPPILPSSLPTPAAPLGEMVLADVYRGLGDVPRGSIKQLRIVQIFPKTTNVADQPPLGMAREENGRAILGTVPVEPDGSARFLVPARKPVYFQALNEDGFAYQTMRSATYVQPGECVSCIGCHEHRRTTPADRDTNLLAVGRPPSAIDPGTLGGRPFSYVEVVQPVLDKHCVQCHGGQRPDGGIDLTGTLHEGFTRSYVALCGDVDFWAAGTNAENAARALVPRFGGRNAIQRTPPGGMYGALGSRLMKLLRAGHENVQLSAQEFRRLAAWIDLNAIFYGVNLPEDQARQLRGEAVPMPQIQ